MYNIPVEVWKDIAGYEGYYQVSNMGSVKSLSRRVKRGGASRLTKTRILKQATRSNGYKLVALYVRGKGNTKYVHRLVLETFGRNIGENMGKDCCHWDGNPANNHIDNLRWGTRKENQNDMIRHGRTTRGERNSNSKLSEKGVLKIKKMLRANVMAPKNISKMFKVHETVISRIKNGKRWGWLK